jgi:ABC-type branched-subunit amino acid transport system substrate-binding protein
LKIEMRNVRLTLAVVGGTLGLSAFGCTALLDVSAYHVTETPADADAAGEAPCAHSDECVAAHGAHWICRHDIHMCRPLLSEDCQRVVGNDKDDDAIIFGSILPLEGPDQSTGRTIENAVELAMDDFRNAGQIPPVPGGTKRRPLVVVACNDQSDGDVAVRAARHLTGDVAVPAIVGAAFSGITLRIATEVTIESQTVLMSPSATSIPLTQLDDRGFVWRTCPSDLLQADAAARLLPLLETQVKGVVPSTSKLKVAVLHKGDSYGVGLADAVLSRLSFNGQAAIAGPNEPYMRRLDFGDPGDPQKPTTYPSTVSTVADFLPHIVFLLGTTETVTNLLPDIEAAWPTGAEYRPYYVMADGSMIDETWQYLLNNDPTDEKRKRILGTVPSTESPTAQAFRHLYASAIHDGTSAQTAGAANAYDALYSLTYAAMAVGNEPLTGRNLTLGFGKQIPPAEKVEVGAGNINTAFQLLAGGGTFDLEGASGPLDYDLSTGEAPSDIQIWCVPRENGKPTSARASTIRFDAASRTLIGTLADARTACGF